MVTVAISTAVIVMFGIGAARTLCWMDIKRYSRSLIGNNLHYFHSTVIAKQSWHGLGCTSQGQLSKR